MNISNRIKIIALALLFAAPTLHNAAIAQVLESYSVMPESLPSIKRSAPNVLVIFDNSTSMQNDLAGNGLIGGAANQQSRSYLARVAMQEVLDELEGDVNMGLMAYQTKNPPGSIPINPLRGGGALYQRVQPLVGDHLDKIKIALLTEDKDSPGIIRSDDHTAMEGSLRHAHEYFKGAPGLPATLPDTIVNSDGITVQLNRTGLPNNDIYLAPRACIEPPVVILVTDGQPSSDPTDPRHTGLCNGGDLVCSKKAIETMLSSAENIKTYVVGFADASLVGNLNQLAAAGGTGQSYFASNGAELVAVFSSIIDEIVPPASSSSGISVIASSSDTAGSVVHAIFTPEIIAEENGEEVRVAWSSRLSAFFFDEFGYLREDNPSSGVPGKLDASYDIDRAFKLNLEDIDSDGDGTVDYREVRAKRIKPINFGLDSFAEVDLQTDIQLADLDPIWEAGETLGRFYNASLSDAQAAIVADTYGTKNRAYDDVASAANGYRRVYSWVQTDPLSTDFDSGSQIEFLYDPCEPGCVSNLESFSPDNYSLFGVRVPDEALAKAETQKIIQYVRGHEKIDGYRNRSINGEAYLLGDIVHSTAIQVDTPQNVYNTRFADSSYSAFQNAYNTRRRMVYVGGNDGLLHAFNGGFWDGSTSKFSLVAPDGSDDTPHLLGAEIWAYAPMNLLPHLQWLTDPGYDASLHVAYMDGPVKVFDVRAFATDSIHVNGWGTIVVAGMRFGGGEYPDVDPDANAATVNNFTARSAYVIIDVTDPREEPVVIGEITHADLGFTTSEPTVMKEGDDWYLVFGSGPNDIKTSTSIGGLDGAGNPVERLPRIYKYKLNEGSRGFASDGDGNDTVGSESGFVGDMLAHDWNADYDHDAVYFGVITGDEADPSGSLYRYVSGAQLASGNSMMEKLIDTGQPVTHHVLPKSFAGKDWIFFGTGRYFTTQDADNDDQNSFYGIIEPRGTYPEVAVASILNVTDVNVSGPTPDANGNLSGGGDLTPPVAGQTTVAALRRHILSEPTVNGWRYDFPNDPLAPTAKNSASPLSFKNLLFYTFYAPIADGVNQCSIQLGESFINVVDLVTGTASFTKRFAGPLGQDANGNLRKTGSLGDGYAHQSYLFIGPDPETGKNRILIKSPLSTGAIKDTVVAIPPGSSGRTSWRELEVQ